jgi:ferredoxin--NADP+ reductase
VRSVAVVGSGPSGCFCTEALLKAAPDCRVDVIDRLPTPFGLVRSGVAPDHQTTKAVSRLLDRILGKPEVGFFGGVELERDVSLDQLRALYDAVVIATGADVDRRLDVPGESLPGVHTSGDFVGWYNHHPGRAAIDLARVRSAVVIGSGNVALDVARILTKTTDEFRGSDLDETVLEKLQATGLERVYVVGRSPAAAMKFTEAELLEFGDLARARAVLGAGGEAASSLDGKLADALRHATSSTNVAEKTIEIVFEFGLTPTAFAGDGRLEAVRFVADDGAEVVREAQLAVTCIGYSARGHGLERAGVAIRNDAGAVEPGLYVVGWAKRGPSGTIPTNRAEAQTVAKRIAAEVTSADRLGRDGLVAFLRERESAFVDHAAWKRIDASEVARADETRTRRKWRSLPELLAAAREPR